MKRRVQSSLGTRNTWKDRSESELFRHITRNPPSSESIPADEWHVPHHIDVLCPQSHHYAFHSERHTAGRSINDHDDTVTQCKRLALQPVNRMGGLENRLARDALDQSALDSVTRLVRGKAIGDLLDQSDRSLYESVLPWADRVPIYSPFRAVRRTTRPARDRSDPRL